MKPTFEEVSKKCPWATHEEEHFAICEAHSTPECSVACLELNCAVWQMIQATKGANNEDK